MVLRSGTRLGIALAALASMPMGSGCSSYRRCSAPDAAVLDALPERLSDTGLYAAGWAERIAADTLAYEPDFELWSDGAAKRRWVALPQGGRIDSSDADAWLFPVGTKFWKEFSSAGRRIETRLLFKHGPAERDWAGASYVWNDEQTEAVLAIDGVQDVGGSGHDVPSAAECVGCHGGRRSHVLGFSALQLARPGLPFSLDDLARSGRLTHVPERAPSVPGNELDRAALGYLHANCGHCHNRQRPPRGDGPRCHDPELGLDFGLAVAAGQGSVRETPAFASSVPRFITPGDPDSSRLLTLVARRGVRLHMPPLASSAVDTDGVRVLRAWIESLGMAPHETAKREPSTPSAATP